jgi:hypothetical protein
MTGTLISSPDPEPYFVLKPPKSDQLLDGLSTMALQHESPHLAMFFALCVCVGVGVMAWGQGQGIVLGLLIVVFGLFSTYKYEQS